MEVIHEQARLRNRRGGCRRPSHCSVPSIGFANQGGVPHSTKPCPTHSHSGKHNGSTKGKKKGAGKGKKCG